MLFAIREAISKAGPWGAVPACIADKGQYIPGFMPSLVMGCLVIVVNELFQGVLEWCSDTGRDV